MNKSVVATLCAFVVAAFFAGPLNGAGETEYILNKNFSTITPIFMAGHEGDMNWVEGFTVSGEILFNGAIIGTVTGEAYLWNPPMNFVDVNDQVSVNLSNTINGMGTFEVRAQGVALGSTTTAATGDIVVSWAGSLANGTGGLANIYGLSAGNVVANFYTGTASATEVLRARFEF